MGRKRKKKISKKVESDESWVESDKEEEDLGFDEESGEDIPKKTKKKQKKIKKKKKKRKKRKKLIIIEEEDEDENENENEIIPISNSKKNGKFPEGKKSEKKNGRKKKAKRIPKKRKRKKKKKKKIINENVEKKSIFLGETPDISQFYQKKQKKKVIPRQEFNTRKRKRGDDESDENDEPVQQDIIPRKKKKRVHKPPVRSPMNYLLVSHVGLADLDEINKFLKKEDIFKLKIYNEREKYFLITDAIHENKFPKLFFQRMKILNPNDYRNRQISVQHVVNNLEDDIIKQYFQEIGNMKISGTKVRHSCRFCSNETCKKLLVTFKDFKSVLDAMDYSGASIRGKIINIKPTFLYDDYRF